MINNLFLVLYKGDIYNLDKIQVIQTISNTILKQIIDD